MISILLLGVLIGMQHAMEADHVAAVASIAADQDLFRRAVAHGAVWGFGHTLTLMAVTGTAINIDASLDAALTEWFEGAVGVMLIGLGLQVFYRLWHERVHFHIHRHDDGVAHIHAHSHKGEPSQHNASVHDPDHPRSLPVRTLLIGVMHGLAGSGTLLILTASTVSEPITGLAYVMLFGLGSVSGMAALSAVIAIPLCYTARTLTWANHALQGAVGAVTVVLGAVIVNATVVG